MSTWPPGLLCALVWLYDIISAYTQSYDWGLPAHHKASHDSFYTLWPPQTKRGITTVQWWIVQARPSILSMSPCRLHSHRLRGVVWPPLGNQELWNGDNLQTKLDIQVIFLIYVPGNHYPGQVFKYTTWNHQADSRWELQFGDASSKYLLISFIKLLSSSHIAHRIIN